MFARWHHDQLETRYHLSNISASYNQIDDLIVAPILHDRWFHYPSIQSMIQWF